MTAQETAAAACDALGLTINAKFVPFSQSRNKHEKRPSLNWLVTLFVDGRPILETDYGAGCGHCPSYKQGRMTVDQAQAVKFECERGVPYKVSAAGAYSPVGSKPILPDREDVVYSLIMDSSSIFDAGGFESWASGLGYDPDSRKAEAVYRACLEIALKLRSGIGEAGMAKLQEAFQDY
jgi:hypothetical protein